MNEQRRPAREPHPSAGDHQDQRGAGKWRNRERHVVRLRPIARAAAPELVSR
jgi:hypothetical protein